MDMDLLFDGAICLIGLGLHFALKWEEHRRTVAALGFGGYLAAVPAQHAISVLGTAAAFTVCFRLGWMNPGLALASGYAGNSIAENVATRFMTPDKKP